VRAVEAAAVAVLLRSIAAKDSPGVVWLEENTLGRLLRLSLWHLFLGVPAASAAGELGFLSAHQLAVAACRYRCCVALYRAFLVQVTTPAPHTAGRVLAGSPDMAEFLAVVAMRETSLGFIRPYPDCKMNISWDFDVLGKVVMKKRMFSVVVPSAGDRRVVDICLTQIIKAKDHQPI
jgi:hypothetical protein